MLNLAIYPHLSSAETLGIRGTGWVESGGAKQLSVPAKNSSALKNRVHKGWVGKGYRLTFTMTGREWAGLIDMGREELLQKGLVLRKITPVRFFMGIGLLFINNGNQDMYLPIFHEDRDYAFSVLTDAMKECGGRVVIPHSHSALIFFEIANDLGRKKKDGPHFWIGAEAVSDQCLGGEERACQDELYIFAADFGKKKIITLK